MDKQIIINKKAPTTIGPYSPTLKIGNLIFISGQIPVDPKSGEIVKGGIEEKVKQVLKNIEMVLEPYSIGLQNVVKTTIYLKDMNYFNQVNKVYAEYFIEKYPARCCIEVSCLPKDAQIEIEAIAYCNE